jgi:nucleoid-associated protein YgaU
LLQSISYAIMLSEFFENLFTGKILKIFWSRGVAWPNTCPCQGQDRRSESGRDRHEWQKTTLLAPNSRPKKGGIMLESVKKQFKNVDSYISMSLGLAVVLIIGALAFNFSTKKPGSNQPATPPNANTVQNQNTPGTHTVIAGETLWTIAEAQYHDGYKWTAIRDANKLTNPDAIDIGQKLILPEVKAEQGQISAASTVKETPKTYTVVPGDYLWKIAVTKYNDGYKWVDIAKANNLVNPNMIHSGNELIIP